MPRRLKTIIVDDDPFIITVLKDLCKDSKLVEVCKAFNNPKDFISQVPGT